MATVLPSTTNHSDTAKIAEQETFTVSTDTERALVLAKITLYKKYPFLGFLIMGTKYLWTDMVPTAAATTSPTATILINPTFFMQTMQDRKERCFVIGHELLHIFLEHIGRQRDNNYNPQLWNVSTDYCINSFLFEMDTQSEVLSMPKLCLYDKKYIGMSSDAIYHALLEENDNDVEKALSKFGATGDMDGKGKKQCALDEVSDEQISEKTKTENRQKIAASISQPNSNDKTIGGGSQNLVSLFVEMVSPTLPWTSLLNDFIIQTSNNRHTYNRVSRRSGEVIFPSMTGDHINLVFGVDTSGSMSVKDLGEAMRELQGIMTSFDSWQVDLLSCDTKPNHIGTYVSSSGDDFFNVSKSLLGGGGTDMTPIVQWASESEVEAAATIIITDGYIPRIYTNSDIPLIIIVTKDGNQDLTEDKLGIDCQIIFMNDY